MREARAGGVHGIGAGGYYCFVGFDSIGSTGHLAATTFWQSKQGQYALPPCLGKIRSRVSNEAVLDFLTEIVCVYFLNFVYCLCGHTDVEIDHEIR